MANSSSVGFGLKPIKMYGNGYENMGLGEYPVAASSDAIYNQDLVCQHTTGYVIVGIAGTEDIIGSLNGVFYTDATTNKPTFQNYLQGSNTATDIVALVNDSPLQQYEIRSDATGASSQASVGEVADITYVAGGSPNYVSKTTLASAGLAAGASKQLKVIGVSRDPENNDLTSANVVWRVVINESFFLDATGI
jgi:hypothetical protein|tara:strand:+ start:1634 stop:2212 length:579 start_codon:yes stop_codon:yes gene_type:complete